MAKTITLPPAGELALPLEQSLTKLPTDSVHNHLHQIAERARATRESLESVELAALILCATELEHIQGSPDRRNGEPWKQWIKANCEFGYTTATKYARVLKAGRDGLIDGLRPDALPDKAPSLMSSDELRDACATLAASLQGLGGIRQLYLKLEIISLPSKTADGKLTIEQNRKADSDDEQSDEPTSNATQDDGAAPSEAKDAEALFYDALKPVLQLFKRKRHLALSTAQADDLRDVIQSFLDDLKLIK